MADVLEQTSATARMEQFWRDRHTAPEVIATYRASEKAEYRDRLVAVLETLGYLGDVLDVGCHCGPVYARMVDAGLPFGRYVGVDINTAVLDEARIRFPEATFILANAREYLPQFADGSRDVVISVAFLSCMDQAAAKELLRHMVRIAKKAVVIQEAVAPDGRESIRGNDGGFREWLHDYPALFAGLAAYVEQQGDVWILWPRAAANDLTTTSALAVQMPFVEDAIIKLSAPFSEPPLRSNKIAIVGWAPSTRHLAPYDDPSVEIWAPGQVGYMLPRCDRIIEIHDNVTLEEENKVGPGFAGSNARDGARPAGYLDRLRSERTMPVYLLKARADLPTSLTFPINPIIQHFGEYCEKLRQQPYITSTFGHGIALAILKLLAGRQNRWIPEGEEIHVYGVDLLSDEEYAFQRSNAEFFGGVCVGAGIRLHIPEESAIFRNAGIYGYANGEGAEFCARLLAHYMTRRELLHKDIEQLRSVHSSAVNNLTRGEAQLRELDTLLVHLETVMRGGSIERPWDAK